MHQGQLVVDWTEQKAAPDAVIEMMSCTCKKTCNKEKCTCISNGLPCTDVCKCNSCTNRHVEDEVVQDEVDMEEGFNESDD